MTLGESIGQRQLERLLSATADIGEWHTAHYNFRVITDSYIKQAASWPSTGRHILAQFDDDSIYVYQAYRPAIAEHAVAEQRFGGEFSYARMSWIKPNFLWMMYRCGWASEEGQERILSIRLRRAFFDELLRNAVPSSYDPARYASRDDWQRAVSESDVRLQWDPDHDPSGRPLERRAVQLGLRGDTLRRYGQTEPLSIEDVTPFIIAQRGHASGMFEGLVTPVEAVYSPELEAARRIGIERAA
jgi:hypothetical protein